MDQEKNHKIDRFEYSEDDFIGKGAFGKVYKGTDTDSGEKVAIKIFDMSLFEDEFLLELLKNEITIMKELKNDHIVQMYEVIQSDSETILIIELCDGDLRKLLKDNGGMLEEQQATQILQQLMEGFKEMVNKNYIHRDIKPENALMKDNIAKVADFGFAVKVDIVGKQLLSDFCGTPLYMAPQLLEQKEYTPKCDIWSIGILAYELVFGKQPWPCRDKKTYLQGIKYMSLRFPYQKPISDQYKDFVQKCLKINEDERIGWDELFSHPILQQENEEKTINKLEIDDRSKQILQKIQQKVQNYNINVKQAFQKFNSDKVGELSLLEFYNFLNFLDPTTTHYETEHLFKYFDNNQDQKLDLMEFQNIFCGYDFRNLYDRAEQIITDLKEIIKLNEIMIDKLFKNFDKDKSQKLEFGELARMVKVLAPRIRQDEIEKIFDKFDKDKDGQISFEEFKVKLTEGTSQDPDFDAKIEKAKKVLTELKSIVLRNEVPIDTIFDNFDLKKNEIMDLHEFSKICFVLDKDLLEDEIETMFAMTDLDNDGIIKLEEFRKLF